ncbi:hypothetical protein DPMN_115901 [Dreissena polymorpha]|uniref:Uncharacterized protein n=1 Tax=Dreissena polymorpha TaxID=45954 RepID=A0A9D4KM24_DREPO|nr:hypothetical protein DPMN_115901 [Dreissena polymorpha]
MRAGWLAGWLAGGRAEQALERYRATMALLFPIAFAVVRHGGIRTVCGRCRKVKVVIVNYVRTDKYRQNCNTLRTSTHAIRNKDVKKRL